MHISCSSRGSQLCHPVSVELAPRLSPLYTSWIWTHVFLLLKEGVKPTNQLLPIKLGGNPLSTFALAPSNKWTWYYSTQYSVVIGATLHQYIKFYSIHLRVCMLVCPVCFPLWLLPTLNPLIRVSGSAGFNNASASVVYTWLTGGREQGAGQSSHRSVPIDCHVGMLATCLPFGMQLLTIVVDKPHITSASYQP